MGPTARFDAYTGPGRLRIALSGDYARGKVQRSEGGLSMTLVDPVLALECDGVAFDELHPDMLALIGVLAFHPVLPTEEFTLTTNFAVSDAVERALRRAWILPTMRILPAGHVEKYVPRQDTVLSYGGGIDSLAAHLLFPEAPLVHETPLPARGAMYEDVVNGIVDQMPVQSHKVFDNLRQLFTAWGLPLWVSVYVAALILQPRYIISGSEMTGTYLMGGQRYYPRFGNLWYRVFADLGVTILPTSFLSEIGNARVVTHHGRMRDAAYCQFIDRQDCDRCTKCLRRRTIRAAMDSRDTHLVEEFNRTSRIESFLNTRPLYYGDVFVHAASLEDTWVTDRLSDLIALHGQLPFHEAYLPDTFEHFPWPSQLRQQAEAALEDAHLPPFSHRARSAFETFQQVPDSPGA